MFHLQQSFSYFSQQISLFSYIGTFTDSQQVKLIYMHSISYYIHLVSSDNKQL